jgi:hypothetical protein
MAKKHLKVMRKSRVTIFKIRNRRGYAAICLGNLTEGKTSAQAIERLKYPLRRMGFELS